MDPKMSVIMRLQYNISFNNKIFFICGFLKLFCLLNVNFACLSVLIFNFNFVIDQTTFSDFMWTDAKKKIEVNKRTEV